MTTRFDEIMGVEDHLQAHGVFTNPLTGRTCHSDSYSAIVNFDKLETAYADSTIAPDLWSDAIEYWTTNPNMQPPLRLVGLTLARRTGGGNR